MPRLLYQSPTEKLERRQQRRRAIVLISVTSIIVIIALFEYYYSNHRNQQIATVEGGTTTVINPQGPNFTTPLISYDFYTPYSKHTTTYSGKLPPIHFKVIASSPIEAIEMFAEQYSLTVDSVQSDNVTYITRDGFQFNTQIKLAKKPSHRHS